MASSSLTSLEALAEQFKTIRDERAMYANTAARVGNAFLAILNYLEGAPFIRKDQEDSTTFLLKLLAGAVIGESDNIKLNPDGSISCGSIKVEGSAIFNELIFNRQNILEGDTYFTDKGIIDSVEHTDVSVYTLQFRKLYDQDSITFHANDILMGKVNRLDSEHTYYSFFLRVESVDTANNTAKCTLYNDADVPGGKNYAPVAAANVIRWGNTIDTSRQSVWFVSSNDGRWLFLQGVNKPILTDTAEGSNYAGFIGIPPDIAAIHDKLDNGSISKSQPYLYFKGLVVQDLIKIDYKGNPQYTARDRGQWSADTTYIKGYDKDYRSYYVDRVWYGGCFWQCSVEASKGSVPRFNNTDWTCLIGSGNMSLDIVSSAGDFFLAGSDFNTTLTAFLYNAEMQILESELSSSSITWLRSSSDTKGDAAWNVKHPTGSVGFALDVSSARDVPDWNAGSSVAFTCVVTFPDGSTVSDSYQIVD